MKEISYHTCNPYSAELEKLPRRHPDVPILLREARHFERDLPKGITSIPAKARRVRAAKLVSTGP